MGNASGLKATRAATLALALGASSLLAACGEGEKGEARADPGMPERARRLAEERILERAKAPGGTIRGVQVFRQAVPGTLAVCGQVNPSGRADEAFLPFVTVVAQAAPEGGGEPRLQLVQHLADTTAEATRVYAEMVSRCVDGGGPRDARRPGAQPLPPLPSGLPREVADAPVPGPRQSEPARPAPPPEPSQPPGPGQATARQHANVRTSPAGGGSVTRVVQPGAALRIFGEAPGGWYQVGDAEPWGWVHGSMLSVH